MPLRRLVRVVRLVRRKFHRNKGSNNQGDISNATASPYKESKTCKKAMR